MEPNYHNRLATLYLRKEYFEISWASLRATVEPAFANRSIINHEEYLPNAHLIKTPAEDITANEVLTAGQKITYDYLVIATGHVDSSPPSKTAKIEYYQDEFETSKEMEVWSELYKTKSWYDRGVKSRLRSFKKALVESRLIIV